jgi:hypothetical protein
MTTTSLRDQIMLLFMITKEKCAYRKLFFRDHEPDGLYTLAGYQFSGIGLQLVAILQATCGLLPFPGIVEIRVLLTWQSGNSLCY